MTDLELDLVSIHTLSNRFEADLLMDALKQEEIPAMLRTFEETPYNGLFVAQRGWGAILVPKGFALRAGEVIKSLLDDMESERPYSDPSGIDPLLWEKLRAADPESICRNAQVRYDASRQAYITPFLDSELLCYPLTQSIEAPSSFHKLDFDIHLVLLRYLLDARSEALTGKWISEKEIPGGDLFFRGPHKFPFDALVEIFGPRPELFSLALERLGGSPVKMGDRAYRVWAFPRIPLLFVFWEGDDEFEPGVTIQFDASIHRHLLNLDIIWAMVNVLCRSIRSAAQAEE